MISLLAIAPDSGWAFVRYTNQFYLVRPPYVAGNRVEVSESTVERAMSGYGFQAASEELSDWGALVHMLRENIVKARERAGGHVPAEGEAGLQLLQYAPPEILGRYLDQVDKELIPSGELRAARKLLNAMIPLEQVTANPAISARAVQLRERCYALLEQQEEVKEKREELANDLETFARQFPKAAARYGKELVDFVASVQRRGRLLEMGT